MMAPFTVPGEFETEVPPNATPPVMMDDSGAPMGMGAPHITFAGFILALLGLKFLTESDLLSLDVKEVKVSLLNIINIGLQASVFIVGGKIGTAALIQRGVNIPGAADFFGAL